MTSTQQATTQLVTLIQLSYKKNKKNCRTSSKKVWWNLSPKVSTRSYGAFWKKISSNWKMVLPELENLKMKHHFVQSIQSWCTYSLTPSLLTPNCWSQTLKSIVLRLKLICNLTFSFVLLSTITVKKVLSAVWTKLIFFFWCSIEKRKKLDWWCASPTHGEKLKIRTIIHRK